MWWYVPVSHLRGGRKVGRWVLASLLGDGEPRGRRTHGTLHGMCVTSISCRTGSLRTCYVLRNQSWNHRLLQENSALGSHQQCLPLSIFAVVTKYVVYKFLVLSKLRNRYFLLYLHLYCSPYMHNDLLVYLKWFVILINWFVAFIETASLSL